MVTPHADTDFSKLVNLCPVKKFSLISTPVDYVDIKFPITKKNYCKTEQKNNICVNVFCYENDLVYPVHVSDQKI